MISAGAERRLAPAAEGIMAKVLLFVMLLGGCSWGSGLKEYPDSCGLVCLESGDDIRG